MDQQKLELYTDYLISSFGATTATGLSAMLSGAISHDGVTRFLSERDYTAKDLKIFTDCVNNQLKFRYVLMDSWFSAKENFELIVKKKRHFVAVLKDNRLVASSDTERQQGRFARVDSLKLSDKQTVRGWLKGFDQAVLIVRRVFKNKDGSSGELNLVCSDLTCDGEKVAQLHQKRWKVEEFHKSLKSNAGLAKSPTRRVRTQQNHVFMSMYAVFKLECLKMTHKVSH